MNSLITKVKNKSNLIFICVLLMIPFILYANFYLKGIIPGDADMIQYFTGKKSFSSALTSGEYMIWNKYLGNGMPEGGLNDVYILSFLLSFLPLRQFIFAYLIIHLCIGGLFFYLYLCQTISKKEIAFFFAVIFECSIQLNGTRRSHPTIIAGICLFPLVMYLVKKYFNTRENKYLYLSAAFSAISATIGIQEVIYGDVILLIFILLWCIIEKYKFKEIITLAIKWVILFIGFFAYSLLPSLSVMSEYSAYGSSDTSYDFFSSYSLHPIKLIQMFVPEFFGDHNLAFGVYNSSEMDIELYLGLFVVALNIYGIFYLKKNNWIKVDFVCGGIALLYSCIAHIPYLNHLAYKIPVIGSFRCSGRMLYVFFFFVYTIAARALEQIMIMDDEKNYQKLNKILICNAIAILVLAIMSYSNVVYQSDVESKASVVSAVDSRFQKTILFSLCYALLSYGIYAINKINKYRKFILIVCALGLTLTELLPYSLNATEMTLEAATAMDETTVKLKSEMGNYKIWDDYNNVDGSHNSIISQNKNSINQMAAINTYTAYNNPNLCKYMNNLRMGIDNIPFNYSGLMTGSQDSQNILLYKQDLLSMLGVKYIIDSSTFIDDDLELQEMYQYWGKDAFGYSIYLNPMARDILYFPNEVKNIEDNNELYLYQQNDSLSEVAFVDGTNKAISKVDAGTVEVEEYRNNDILATYNVTKDSFICFSQNYSPNWKAYIDGQPTDVIFTNGLIMGVNVTAGKHQLKFVYRDIKYIAGYCMTLLTMIALIVYLVFDKKEYLKDRKSQRK